MFRRQFRFTRREFILGSCVGFVSACAPSNPVHIAIDSNLALADATSALANLEIQFGGRVGVAALNTKNDLHFAHRGDERFAMCSTFKWMLAAAVLTKVDRGEISLDQLLPYSDRDLLSNSPTTERHVKDGAMSVDSLCESIIEVSDNTAANLLLRFIGGPSGLTHYLREQKDETTRLDRYELDLNTNLKGDVRDTTTPNGMVKTMRSILVGDALSETSRHRLTGWMVKCRTGSARIRAGLPASWIAGDKTGTGGNSAVNDLAIMWPPSQPPILLAVYLSESSRSVEDLNTVHAKVGAIVAESFASDS